MRAAAAAALVALAVAGCARTPPAPAVPAPVPGARWGAAPASAPCRAAQPTELLRKALATGGLDESGPGFDGEDLGHSHYERAGVLADVFRPSWLEDVRAHPARIGCFEGAVVGSLDAYLAGPHPVSDIIRHAARLLDEPPDAQPPYVRDNVPGDFEEAIDHLCRLAEAPPAGCGAPRGRLPPDLAEALTPLLWAIAGAVQTHREMHRALEVPPAAAESLRRLGGNFLGPSMPPIFPDLRNPSTLAYYRGGGHRARLYRAASQIAFAVEQVPWQGFAGDRGVEYDVATPWGAVRVRDAAAHRYREDGEPVLLLVDLGGDDLYYGPVAANGAGNPVSIAVDLAGADTYRYPEHAPSEDARLLAPDRHGRYPGDERAGPFTLSVDSRQGAARNGVAMLFDLGTRGDHYQSLRASQGYAHLGVGVLFDAGGHDRYLAEATSQGAALFGIGLAIDAGAGNDLRRAFVYSQGFAYVGGFGLLVDGGGDDIYVCEHGNPAHGGLAVYPNSQLRGEANLSFCQGVGFGRRRDAAGVFLSGGLGVLRDAGGDDRYEAALFAQGSGYWQGVGILSDGGGSDHYDAYYYVQGGSAHYAVGVLSDDGPEGDRFNTLRPPRYMQLGAGHDYSVGVLINEGGDDVYRFAGLAAGASHCNGVGLFVDNAGDDTYLSSSDYGSGMGNVGAECRDARPEAASIGVMIDAGGDDRYRYPAADRRLPSNGGEWGERRNELPSEHGIGVDRDGDTGIHPGG